MKVDGIREGEYFDGRDEELSKTMSMVDTVLKKKKTYTALYWRSNSRLSRLYRPHCLVPFLWRHLDIRKQIRTGVH